MSEYSRDDFLKADPKAADKAADEFTNGGPFRLEKGRDYYLRFMPPYKEIGGDPHWWSFGRIHFGVPGANTESGKKTFACPAFIGQRCLVCEKEKDYKRLGMWEYSPEGGVHVEPQLICKFNVIDLENIEKGVQILEDKKTLFDMLRRKLNRNPNLLDPFEGRVLIVTKLDGQPWREVEKSKVLSLDEEEFPDDTLEQALPQNLPQLDETWDYPSVEQQLEWFNGSIEEAVENGNGQEAIEGEVVEQEDTEPEVVEEEAPTEKSSMIEELKAAREGG